MGNKGAKPRQRTDDLVVRMLGAETLVLDRRTDTAHSLPAEVSRVWAACTGKNTLAEIASAAGIDKPTAASAVDQLMEAELLEVPAGTDRRQFLRRTALIGAGAATFTGITSVAAAPAWAQGTEIDVFPNPDFGITCGPALNNGSAETTIEFQIRATGPGLVAGQSYDVTLTLPDFPTATWKAGSGNAVSGEVTNRIMVSGNPPTGNTSTIDVAGTRPTPNPDGTGNPAGTNNSGPLPETFLMLITITSVATGLPVVSTTLTFTNICCTEGEFSTGPSSPPGPGCIINPAGASARTDPVHPVHPADTSSPSPAGSGPAPRTSSPSPAVPSPAPRTSSPSPTKPTGSPSASP